MPTDKASHPALGFAARLRAGGRAIGGWFTPPEAQFAGMVASGALDAVVLDVQHGLQDATSIVDGIAAVTRAGKPALVRIAVGDFALAARALDVGAIGVIAPMIDTAADARAFVAQVKYPPLGRRSWGAGRAMALLGVPSAAAQLSGANDATLALAMVETREAVEAIDEILAVDGLDGVFVGPNDLSIALTDGARVDVRDPLVDAALDRIVAAARRAGKVTGIFGGAPADARAFREKGFGFVTLGYDIHYVVAGIAAMRAEMGEPAAESGTATGY
jgi:4-hydroxy-2-oxoheptanedioate aldolase